MPFLPYGFIGLHNRMEKICNTVEKVLKKAPQYTRLRRHIISVLSHSSAKKVANFLAIEIQRKLHLKKVIGYPYILILDPGNICNLRCPLCPTGQNMAQRHKQLIKLENFKKIIDRLFPFLFEAILHNWGEPFLNPDIFDMIRYCTEKNVSTNLSTHMNIRNLDVEAIIASGLEYLIVSLDGTTQDVYSKYRVNGNIDLVFENINNIVKKKKGLKSKFPFIEWQYIVMKHNYHQIEDAKKIAAELGVDLIRFIPVGLPLGVQNTKELAEKWFPYIPNDQEGYIEERFLQKPIKGGCFYLYRSITINPDGSLAPCCAVWESQDIFGDFAHMDFSEIWNNKYYQSARALFSKKKLPMKTVCNRCHLFSKP